MVIMKKIILIIFVVLSLLIITYGIGFIMNYFLVIKYSVEDCLPLCSSNTLADNDRLNEIHTLITYATIIIAYAIYALSLVVYYIFSNNKK